MAKLVVLRFEDDAEADEFCNSKILYEEPYYHPVEATSVTVEGVYKTPTLFCECTDGGKAWARGSTRGWWVHALTPPDKSGCGKPSPSWGENHRSVIGSAVNEIERPSKNTEELYVTNATAKEALPVVEEEPVPST
jgi:hypothetical protein